MTTALPPELDPALTTFTNQTSIVVATDFDGVLAPLVLNPLDSRPLPGTIEALSTLAQLPGVTAAIVSGRDLATLRQLTGLHDSPVVLIGSHGAETSEPVAGSGSSLTEEQSRALSEAEAIVRAAVAQFPAARLEQKPAGVVLHTRGLPDADAHAASEVVLARAQAAEGIHAMRGKSVVELSVLDVSKGSALASLLAQRGANHLFYMGDDVTDETVFARFPEGDHVMVKVGDGPTQARFAVATPQDAAQVLRTIELKAAQRGA